MTDETVKPDDPNDSAETLRIMADLERYADMHAPTLSDSADVMDEARHRLAVLQQACNAYPGLRNRVAALEAELAKKDELLHECLPAVRNNAQAEAEGGDPFAAAAWNVIADCVEASLAPKEPHVQGT